MSVCVLERCSLYSRDSMPDVDRTKRNKREFKKEEEEGGRQSRHHSRAGRDGFHPNITSCHELQFGLDDLRSLSNRCVLLFFLFLPYISEVKKTKINMQQYFIFKKRKCTSKNRHMEIIRENNPFTNKGFWLKDHLGNTNAIDDG